MHFKLHRHLHSDHVNVPATSTFSVLQTQDTVWVYRSPKTFQHSMLECHCNRYQNKCHLLYKWKCTKYGNLYPQRNKKGNHKFLSDFFHEILSLSHNSDFSIVILSLYLGKQTFSRNSEIISHNYDFFSHSFKFISHNSDFSILQIRLSLAILSLYLKKNF